jgi:hypothetical protein
VALVFIFIDFISIPAGNNTGGHLAHIGGALGGWLFIKQLQAGNDWSVGFTKVFNWISNTWERIIYQKPKPPVQKKAAKPTAKPYTAPSEVPHAAPSSHTSATDQAAIDAILDKIKRSGYDSLSAEEREKLFKFSKNS